MGDPPGALMEKISDLRGKAILTADGKNVGTLADLAVDGRAWSVAALVVEVDPAVAGLFGVKKKLLKSPRVRIASGKVEHVADVVKLRDELGHLKVELQDKEAERLTVGGLELLGKDVMTSDGRNVGQVEDLAIDITGWRVRDLRVAIDKRIGEELGLQVRRGGKFHIRTASIKSVGDLIMLNQTMKMLAEQVAAAGKAGDEEPLD